MYNLLITTICEAGNGDVSTSTCVASFETHDLRQDAFVSLNDRTAVMQQHFGITRVIEIL